MHHKCLCDGAIVESSLDLCYGFWRADGGNPLLIIFFSGNLCNGILGTFPLALIDLRGAQIWSAFRAVLEFGRGWPLLTDSFGIKENLSLTACWRSGWLGEHLLLLLTSLYCTATTQSESPLVHGTFQTRCFPQVGPSSSSLTTSQSPLHTVFLYCRFTATLLSDMIILLMKVIDIKNGSGENSMLS